MKDLVVLKEKSKLKGPLEKAEAEARKTRNTEVKVRKNYLTIDHNLVLIL